MGDKFDTLTRPPSNGLGALNPSRVSGLTIEGDKSNNGMLNLIGYTPLLIGSDTKIPPYNYDYPLFRNKGRTELIGGVSISTNFHDCIVGKTDIKCNDHLNDQIGSLLIHNKGRTTNDTLGLEVYYGSRIFHKNKAGLIKTSTNEKHRYEYILDNSDLTHSNTYADKIKLHSDTNTILTNGSHNTLELKNDGINSQIQMKSFNNVINLTKDYIEFKNSDSSGNYIKIDNNTIDIYSEKVNIVTKGNNQKLFLGISDNNYIEMITVNGVEEKTIHNDKLYVNSDNLIYLKNTSGSKNEIKLDDSTSSLELRNFQDNQIILDKTGIDSSGNENSKQIKLDSQVISMNADSIIKMKTPMVEISNKLNVKDEIIIGNRHGKHYRITTNNNNNDTSLVIHKYSNYNNMDGIVCEFDL